MKRAAFVSFVVIAALLIAAVPAFANEWSPPYWDMQEDGMEAWLIHDTDVLVFEFYALDCYGQEYYAEFEEPWTNIGWITMPEYGEGPLNYIGVGLVYWDPDEEGWVEAWVEASRECEAPPSVEYYPCIEVTYGNTLESISHEMLGTRFGAYNGSLLVCESAVGDWGEGCVPSAEVEVLYRGMWVCPTYAPRTGGGFDLKLGK